MERIQEAHREAMEKYGDYTEARNALGMIANAMESEKGYFPITSVCRADLEGEGYDTSEVDDSTMRRLASKMADAYCDTGYWIDLGVIADYLEIPKKHK